MLIAFNNYSLQNETDWKNPAIANILNIFSFNVIEK